MIALQTIGILACIVLLATFAALYGPARRLDRLDECHLMHGPDDGCPDCSDK